MKNPHFQRPFQALLSDKILRCGNFRQFSGGPLLNIFRILHGGPFFGLLLLSL